MKLRKLFNPWTIAVVAIFLAGLGLRVVKSAVAQYSPNSDYGFVALMAKHMAEGRDFPVFFYGQPYMGSLEPAVSALMCLLFGTTGFAVCLGTAVVGSLLLLLLYGYGRDAGGRWAGLLAMLYGVVGSDTNLHYSVVPRGGYMTMMVCGLAVLWMACRASAKGRDGGWISLWLYFAMGVLAGLGWWSNQLVIVFLLAAAAILLIGSRENRLWAGVAPGLAGFFLGALPWWLWNVTHAWGSFDFAGSFGKVGFDEGMQSFWGQLLILLEFTPIEAWWHKARVLLFAVLFLAFLGLMVRDAAKRVHTERFYYQLALPILAILMVLIYATSHYARFETSRYIMPLIPAAAIMLGVVCSRFLVWRRIPAGVLVFVAVLPSHILVLNGMTRDYVENRELHARARRLADELGPLCGGVCLADWGYHWMNFATAEKLCVAYLPSERYAPYGQRAELADRPAFINQFRRVRDFLRATGGKSVQTVIEKFPVDYALEPPSDAWRYVEPGLVASAENDQGASILGATTDSFIDTQASLEVNKRTPRSMTFTFRDSRPVCGIRLLSFTDHYPAFLKIEAQSAENGPWQLLLPPTWATGYFWSGPCPFFEGIQYYAEYRFPAPPRGIRGIRMTFDAGWRELDHILDTAEILFMESAGRKDPALPSVDSCVGTIHSQGVRRIYAPRWLSERIWTATHGAVEAPVSSLLKRSVYDITLGDRSIPQPMRLDEFTGLIMDERDAARTRALFKNYGMLWRETPMGRYVLLSEIQPDPKLWVTPRPVLYWTELGCFELKRGPAVKENADWLYRRIMERKEQAAPDAVIRELQEVLLEWPEHQPARKALAAELEKAGRAPEAAEHAAELRRQTEPETAASMRYADGVEFLGLTLSSREVKRGGTLEVTYYWRCPPAVLRKKLPDVFVHFTNGGNMFQDDHTVLGTAAQEEIQCQPFDEVLSQTRQVVVPASAAPGTYSIRMGRKSAVWRSAVDTELPQERRAAELPVALTVRP